jgi:MazG family protein
MDMHIELHMKTLPPTTLRAIMDRLRAPGGCPWDLEQTIQSLAKYISEECAEALDAIAGHDPNDPESEAHLCEELGDVWLQVAFQACLASERGAFDIHDVESMVVEKLLRRHPHVFGDIQVENSDQVLANWQTIKLKEKEKGGQPEPGLLENIPDNLSSLNTAMEIGHRCAKVGFDWDGIDGVMEKVKEEIAELQNEETHDRVEAEFGDVLFSLIQWARHKKIDPDLALRKQISRFKQRFRYVEASAQEAGGWESCDLDKMESAWQKAKNANRQ